MNGPCNVMVDVETLGTGDGAMIVQIGAVRFWPYDGENGLISVDGTEFCADVEVSDANGRMDAETVLWWLRQPKEAQQRVFGSLDRKPLLVALTEFEDWLAEVPVEGMWANPPSFDLRLLREARRCVFIDGRTIKVDHPLFDHRLERCFRTLKKIGKKAGVEEPLRVGVHHDARDDAFHQAGWAIKILRACNASS